MHPVERNLDNRPRHWKDDPKIFLYAWAREIMRYRSADPEVAESVALACPWPLGMVRAAQLEANSARAIDGVTIESTVQGFLQGLVSYEMTLSESEG
jgi:hypothetical protein